MFFGVIVGGGIATFVALTQGVVWGFVVGLLTSFSGCYVLIATGMLLDGSGDTPDPLSFFYNSWYIRRRFFVPETWRCESWLKYSNGTKSPLRKKSQLQ